VYDVTINTKAECDAQLYIHGNSPEVAMQAVWDASQGCASTDGCEWVATNTGGSAHAAYPSNKTTGICRDSCANMEHQEVVGGYTGANMPANGVAICNNIAGCTAGAHPTKSAWDEAHFYRECANKGVCNRASGQCECFAGYVGEGCTRTQCPNNCSGHGVCKRAIDIDATYLAWDAYKTQSCVCDPGYAGNDCSQRNCPFGDDPITRIGDITEIQSFGIATDGDADAAEKSLRQLTNTHKAASEAWFSLEFTDEQGDKWVTRSVDFLSPNVAEDVESALEALPNRVIEDVEVSFFTGNQSGCTSCVYDQTGAVNSGTPRKALGRWVSVTFTHNSGDIPDLGARYDWRYNMPTDATETSQHASGNRKWKCAGVLVNAAGNYASGVTALVVDGTSAVDAFVEGGKLYKTDGTLVTTITTITDANNLAVTATAVGLNDDDPLCTDAPNTYLADSVATSRITNLPDGSFGRTGFVLSKGLRATPRAVDGNKENAPCSNRGLCDYSSGTCKCFAGYTDFDCSVQNALSMG
jgi:Tfp pilus assembly protein PilV